MAAAERVTVTQLQRWRDAGRPIAAITAYDAPTGRLCDEAGVDVVLVGDSLGNVVLGLPDTIGVTVPDMLRHTEAVARAVRRALVVADMPFLSYQTSAGQAVANAGALVRAGASAVKLEGGGGWSEAIRLMVQTGIPVMGHLGYTPQSIRRFGRPRVQGRDPREAADLVREAETLQEAGVFAIVLEMVPSSVAAEVTRAVTVPTIGIGAGAGCSGQILVLHDVIGITEKPPRFVRSYGQVGRAIADAVSAYVLDVRAGVFPGPAETHYGHGWGQGQGGDEDDDAGDGPRSTA